MAIDTPHLKVRGPMGPGANDRSLITNRTPESLDQKLLRWFGTMLGALLVGYLFLDRGFAHFHVPHTPAYLAEITLLFGGICIAAGTRWLRYAVAGDILLGVVLVWMFWGLVRTVPNFSTFGIQNSVHDAALWYYGAFAILFVAAATAVPDLPVRWVRGFSRVVPILSVWLLTSLILNKTGFKGPTVRLDNVPLLSHRPGNICVVASMCLVWLWLVPDQRRSPVVRMAVSVVSLLTIILGATQTRGGGLAAAIAIVLGIVLIGRHRRPAIALGLIATVVVGFAIASITGAALHTQKRTFSISQLVQNVESLGFGTANNPQLQSTENFRFALWSRILDDQTQTAHLVDGFGFGPNLAQIGGINRASTHTQLLSLRSAHNSQLDVFARTGILGATIWIMMFAIWYRRMWRAHRRYALFRNDADRGLIDFCMVSIVAIMVNSVFDPTLESAQVAAVAFCIFGFGIIVDRREVLSSTVVPTEPTTRRPAIRARVAGT